MPVLSVKCKSCGEILSTRYFTIKEEPQEIATLIEQCNPVKIECGKCRAAFIYSKEDFGVAGEKI